MMVIKDYFAQSANQSTTPILKANALNAHRAQILLVIF